MKKLCMVALSSVQIGSGDRGEERALPEVFALICGQPVETTATKLVGEGAAGLLVKQARLGRMSALAAYGLYGLSVSLVLFLMVAMSIAEGGIIAMLSAVLALTSFGYARSLLGRRYEPTLAELLLVAENEAQRDCLNRLEAIRDSLSHGELIATFDDPKGIASKEGKDRVRPEAFAADHGRLLILFNDHAWAVRSHLPVRRVPIRVPAPETPRWAWQHWLEGMSPEQAENWYNEFCKQARITIDTRERHVVAFRCACEVLAENPGIDQPKFMQLVLKRIAAHSKRLGLNDDSIRRLIGDNRSDAHRYGAFRRYVLERKLREARKTEGLTIPAANPGPAYRA